MPLKLHLSLSYSIRLLTSTRFDFGSIDGSLIYLKNHDLGCSGRRAACTKSTSCSPHGCLYRFYGSVSRSEIVVAGIVDAKWPRSSVPATDSTATRPDRGCHQ